jgi:hypothetical protein
LIVFNERAFGSMRGFACCFFVQLKLQSGSPGRPNNPHAINFIRIVSEWLVARPAQETLQLSIELGWETTAAALLAPRKSTRLS